MGFRTAHESHRRCLFVVLAVLAIVAALGPGAQQASARDAGCDCHSAVPPTGGAPPFHGSFVAAVTECATCHVGMPTPCAELGHQKMAFCGTQTAAGLVLSGKLWSGPGGLKWMPHGNVGIYLQQRLWGETGFTDLTQVATDGWGGYGYAVPSPAPYAAYHAVAQGCAFQMGVFLPRTALILPKPTLALRLSGLRQGVLPAGGTLTGKGSVLPLGMTDESVQLVVERFYGSWQEGTQRWVTVRVLKARIGATGSYARTFTLKAPGKFRVHAVLRASDLHRQARTSRQRFAVK